MRVICFGLFNRNIKKAIQIVLDNNHLDDICASFPSTNIIWMIVDILSILFN
jgi:hypothetical protein